MLAADNRDLFPLEQGSVYLNHGGYGVMPHVVMEEKKRVLAEVEKNPTAFFAGTRPQQWSETNKRVAQRFSLDPNAMTIVDNATDGMNVVLRSLSFAPGDEILLTSLAYGAVSLVAHRIAAECGAKIIRAELRFPNPDPAQCVDAVTKALTPKTRIALFDHITASTGLVMPIAEMAAACRQRHVPVAVDGAHAPGQVALDIPALKVNWYVGNLHKWYFVPRGCGFLWAAPDSRENLKPNVLSWTVNSPYPANFERTGTRDPSSWLSIPAAFDFMDRFGESAVRQHNAEMLRKGVALLADAWKFRNETLDAMTAAMTLIPLPGGLPYPPTNEGLVQFGINLRNKYGITVLPSFTNGEKLWIRISAQIYNGIEDYDRLAKAVLDMQRTS